MLFLAAKTVMLIYNGIRFKDENLMKYVGTILYILLLFHHIIIVEFYYNVHVLCVKLKALSQ